MLKSALRGLLLAAALVAGTNAAADVVTFEFFGRVSSTSPMARQGAPVLGRFSWDTSAPLSPPYEGASQSVYTAPYTFGISFQVGAHKVSSDQMNVVVWNDLGGNVGDMIDIGGARAVIDGTLFENGHFDIRLASAPGNTTALSSPQLPSELNVDSFDSVGMNYFQLLTGVVSNEVLLDVKLEWIRRTAAP